MKVKQLILILMSILAIASCKKEAGDGGNSSISGRVMIERRRLLDNYTTAEDTIPAADQDVFIIYGDHVSPDDRIQTNYDGEFEFLYLRPGNYTIYTFSKDTTATPTPWGEDHLTILQKVEITEKKQNVSLNTMFIYDVYEN
jgi:hypothetical protein